MPGVLFGRERELSALQQHIGTDRIVLVLGPQNSGKTALLMQLEQTCCVPVHLLDMRMDISIVDVILRELATANSKRGKRPIVIIDHAEKITALPNARQIFRSLLGLAQDGTASVIAASSYDSVREEIGDAFVDIVYVDHFGRGQAKQFFNSLLGGRNRNIGSCWWRRLWPWKNHDTALVSDEEFERIYQVCGGCPLLLKHCAHQAYLIKSKPLDDVLGFMADSVGSLISRGLIGGEWESDKFRKVMELMLERNGAVEWETVCNEAFDGDNQLCDSQLKAMAGSYIIHIKSIPAEGIKMVCPLSPAQLEAMRDELLREQNEDDD